MLRFAPVLTLALVLGPIVAGLAGTLLPAFGFLPAIGRDGFSAVAWLELIRTPGVLRAIGLALGSGFAATLLSLLLAVGFAATSARHPSMRRFEQAIPPILATPHVALAIGFAFLILPSGWIARLMSPEITGWMRPPPFATVRDPEGIALVAGLVLKEFPFLLLMVAATLSQVPHRQAFAAARALGYPPGKAWIAAVFPRIYAQIRLPVFAVLVFSMSVVDVAIILGPGTPPPLAVLATRWFSDYDLTLYPRAAAAAVLQLLLTCAAIAIWRGGEIGCTHLATRWLVAGGRRRTAGWLLSTGAWCGIAAIALAVASMLGLLVWSVAEDWRFPDDWPTSLSLATWDRQWHEVGQATVATLVIGGLSTLCALVLALACLENERRRRLRPGSGTLWLLYIPLLVPQIAFVFGLQVWLVRLGLDGTVLAVVWSHLTFVLPYVFLGLADPFRALDTRYERASAAMGLSPGATFLRVKLPILLKPILVSASVGFAVSVAMYLPTLFAGAGRIATLTTEAVTLSSGADRRILGVYGTLQAAMPLLVFLMALAVPRYVFRNRRGLG